MVKGTLAIIPARGGSKRIPKKNIIDFFGKPMIALTIEAALKSLCFDEVIVSTDDAEIAEIAINYGAQVPFLRKKAADDVTPVSYATLCALLQAEKYWNCSFENVVQLMPNCPIRSSIDIVDAMSAFSSIPSNFQISCFKYGWMNPWWAAKLKSGIYPEFLYPDAISSRSQDLDELYCPTGAIWIAQSQALKDQESFYGVGHVFKPLAWTSAIDIDDYEDLKMAEAVYLMQNRDKFIITPTMD